MKQAFLFILIFSVTGTMIKSQDTIKSKIIVYEPFKSNTIEQRDIKTYNNVIKWNIGMLARGSFLINYERLISEKISVESGIGLTYQDYMYEPDENGIYESLRGTNSLNTQPGFLVEIAPRIYPGDVCFEGFYASLIYRYRYYNMVANDPYSLKGNYDIGYKISDAAFIIGFQVENSVFDILYDYYFGVSMRSETYFDRDQTSGDQAEFSFKKITKSAPALLLGIKIGFQY